VNKITLIVAIAALGFIGWLYLGEMSEVSSTKAAVAAAADRTAVALSQAPDLARNTDVIAGEIFRKNIQKPAGLEEVAVRQNVEPLSPGRLRQSVRITARARTKLSEFFNMQGAEIEVVATHDFNRKE